MNTTENETFVDLYAGVLAKHRDALAIDGIASDGEWAWFHCTCGARWNFEMPEDDIWLAQASWEQHLAEALAAAIQSPKCDHA